MFLALTPSLFAMTEVAVASQFKDLSAEEQLRILIFNPASEETDSLLASLITDNPRFCANPSWLEFLLLFHMNALSADCIRLLATTLREEFVGPRMALQKVFPLNDLEKALIFVEVFGYQELMRVAGARSLQILFSQEVAQGLIPAIFDDREALIAHLTRYIYQNMLRPEIAALRNDQDETLLMKMSEYFTNEKIDFDCAGVLKFLATHSDVNAIDKKGETALIKAAKNRNSKTACLLLSHHANYSIKDSSGKDANAYALEHGLVLGH